MSIPLQTPRPGTPVVGAGRGLSPEFERFFDDFVRAHRFGIVPPGGVVMCVLSASDISEYFDATGLGNTNSPYDSWAICNGNNDTPDLDGKAPRFEASASGGAGNYDNAGAGSTYDLVPLMKLERS